jgi:hypothetical protein
VGLIWSGVVGFLRMDTNPPRLANCVSIFYASKTSYGVCATSCPLSVSTHRKEQERQPTVVTLCGLLFPSKKSPAITKSYEYAFVYFNLGLALLAYSPFLAGIGTLTNPPEKKRSCSPGGNFCAHHHTTTNTHSICWSLGVVFYRRDSACFWEVKERF